MMNEFKIPILETVLKVPSSVVIISFDFTAFYWNNNNYNIRQYLPCCLELYPPNLSLNFVAALHLHHISKVHSENSEIGR